MFFRVAIDGLLQSQLRVNLANLPPPSEIYAIEVFSGAATVPVQYNKMSNREGDNKFRACGLIAIWTR